MGQPLPVGGGGGQFHKWMPGHRRTLPQHRPRHATEQQPGGNPWQRTQVPQPHGCCLSPLLEVFGGGVAAERAVGPYLCLN